MKMIKDETRELPEGRPDDVPLEGKSNPNQFAMKRILASLHDLGACAAGIVSTRTIHSTRWPMRGSTERPGRWEDEERSGLGGK